MLFSKYSHGEAHFYLAFAMGGIHLAGEGDKEIGQKRGFVPSSVVH